MNEHPNANDCPPFGFGLQPPVYDMNVPQMYPVYAHYQNFSWPTTTHFSTQIPTEHHQFYPLQPQTTAEQDLLGSAVVTRARAATLTQQQQQPPAHSSYPSATQHFATENQPVSFPATIEISAAPQPPTPSSAFNPSHDTSGVQHSRQGSLTTPLPFAASPPFAGSTANDSTDTVTPAGSHLPTPQAPSTIHVSQSALNVRGASPAMTISSISRASSFQFQASETNQTRSTMTSSPGSSTIVLVRPTSRKLRLKNLDKKAICEYARKYPKKRQEDIALLFGIERSTVSKVLKKKDQWLSLDDETGNARTKVTKFPAVDKAVAGWAKEQIDQGQAVSDANLRKHAKMVARSQGIPESKFKASSGWLENFKSRHRIRKGRYTTPSVLASPEDNGEFMINVNESQQGIVEDTELHTDSPTAIPEMVESDDDDDVTLTHTSFANYAQDSIEQVLRAALSKPLPMESTVAIDGLGSHATSIVTPQRSNALSSSTSTNTTAVETIVDTSSSSEPTQVKNYSTLASPIQLRDRPTPDPLELHRSLLVMRSFLTDTIPDSLTAEQKTAWANIEREVMRWSVMQMGGEVSFASNN